MSTNETERLRRFDREMMRSMFVSLFAAVIQGKKKNGKYTLQMLADSLGGANKKFEVSRWFRGSPNWTLNTISDIAGALDVEISIEARDRHSGRIYTPSGNKVSIANTVSISSMYGNIKKLPQAPFVPKKQRHDGMRVDAA